MQGQKELSIDARVVGSGHPTFLIAEVAQAHDGSLGAAHSFVEAAADAGADAVKFQTHIAAEESTQNEPFRVAFSDQDDTRYDYWQRMEFTPEQWSGLADHAADREIVFLSSPFSAAAVALLEKIGMPAWKIGSGEFRSDFLLKAMAATKSPILFSTGMSTWAEIDAVVERLKDLQAPFALMQCTSEYPTTFERVGLNIIEEMRTRYGCLVGLSDHSGSPLPGLAAMANGADILEVHVTFDRKMFGPDTKSSVTFSQLSLLANARDGFHAMATHPVDKDSMASDLAEMRNLFTRSFAPAMALKSGTVLAAEMLVLKKPGTGIPESEISSLVGRKLRRDVLPDHLLVWDDIE